MSANLLVLVVDDLEKVPHILEAWEQLGVPGVTMLDSIGSKRLADAAQEDMPPLVSLRAILEGEGMPNRVIFSLLNDEAVLERAIAAAEHLIGDFGKPHTGIMFVLPVARGWGILKVHPHGH